MEAYQTMSSVRVLLRCSNSLYNRNVFICIVNTKPQVFHSVFVSIKEFAYQDGIFEPDYYHTEINCI